MNILLNSHFFHPSIGGLEMMAQELGTAWKERGHEVQVVTATDLEGEKELSELEVFRSPSHEEWIELAQWADVFFQNGISLRSVAYPFLVGCPVVFRHPGVLEPNPFVFFRDAVRRLLTVLGANVASCQAVAAPVLGPTVAVPNTFRSVFDQPEVGSEDRDGLLFVGRLVTEKGVDVAIDALQLLKDQEIDRTLTICGDGSERAAMERRVRQLGLQDRVTFNGWASSEELAVLYREAEVLLVPSRHEPFGIVALEALASRCPVVASNVDGLPEAVGDCGLLVQPEDPEALADAAIRVLRDDVREELQAAMPAHVNRHRTERIATDYLHVLRAARAST